MKNFILQKWNAWTSLGLFILLICICSAFTTVQRTDLMPAESPLILEPPTNSGGALDFDGQNDYVQVPHLANLNLTGDFSIEVTLFLKPGSTELAQSIVDKTATGDAANYRCHINTNSQKMGFWNGSGNVWSTHAVPMNQWVSIAWVYDASNQEMTFYIDGQARGKSTTTLGGVNNGPLSIARDNNKTYQRKRYAKVKIDDLSIWNRVRCQEEIKKSRSVKLNGYELGLVAYYPFNQGAVGANNSSETVLKEINDRHNGTLTNIGLTGNTSNWVAGGPYSWRAAEVSVNLGPIPSIGDIDGTYLSSVSLHEFQNQSGNSCHCWTRTDGQYSLANVSGYWYVFQSSTCPNDLSNVTVNSGAIGFGSSCDPATVQGIDRCP